MITTKTMYRDYINSLKDKANNIKQFIQQCEKDKKYIYRILHDNKKAINNNTNLKFNTVDDIVSFNDDVRLNKFTIDGFPLTISLLQVYIKNIKVKCAIIVKYTNILNNINNYINTLKNYDIYKTIIREFNKYISKSILDGEKVSLGFNTGILCIVEKKKYYGEDYNSKIPDWSASYKELVNIAKEYKPVVYKEYIEGNISRIVLKDKLVDIIYNKEKNPTGIKWLMFNVDDYSYWFYWSKNRCRIKGKYAYKFTPTGFNNTGKSLPIIAEEYSKDELMDLNIGNIQRLSLYRNIDSSHYLKYRKNGVSSN